MKIVQSSLLTALISLPVYGQATSNSDWQFEITPYLWAAGMEGTFGTADMAADIDMSFADIWATLDKAFIINMEARKGQWSTWFDFVKLKIADDGKTRLFDVDVNMSQTLAEVAGAYQPAGWNQIELFAGARYTDVDSSAAFKGTGPAGIYKKIKLGDDWIDPFVGVRGNWQLNDKWSLRARGDVGGFGVGSDLAWHAVLGAKYQLNDLVSFKLGYRYLDVDYDDNNFVFDMAQSGVALGVGFSF